MIVEHGDVGTIDAECLRRLAMVDSLAVYQALIWAFEEIKEERGQMSCPVSEQEP